MSTPKTIVTDASAVDYINSVQDEVKKQDSLALLALFSDITSQKPKMWGSSIIGFGQYHYKSDRSKQEGDWPLTGFSPRKHNLTLYIMTGFEDYADLLANLGKHKTSKGCLYINKLADINLVVLANLIKQSYAAMQRQHA